MKFQTDAIIHLTSYMQRKFPLHPRGKWRETDEIPLTYAFTKNDRLENLIDDYKNDFLKSRFKLEDKIKLHMYFNHLNSSQAMCINFFFPLCHEEKLDVVLEYLGFANEKLDYKSVRFEKESEIDSKGGRRPTNFDFYFKTVSGKQFFFEIKYTENEFGKAKDDDDHRDKFDAVYKDALQHINPAFATRDEFFQHYQVMRNLIHIDEQSYVVFVYPEGNKKIKEGAEHAKTKILDPDFGSHQFNVTWENILKKTIGSITLPRLTGALKEFERKYFFECNFGKQLDNTRNKNFIGSTTKP